ncbi:hypothetical protein GCM10020001_118910 [Nonomuraea salmonea]
MNQLQDLLNALARGEEGADDVAELFAGVEDLAALEAEALGVFDGLMAADTLSDEDMASLEALAEAVEAIRGEQGRRDQVAAEQRARREELAARVAPPAGDNDDDAAGDSGEGDGAGDDGGAGDGAAVSGEGDSGGAGDGAGDSGEGAGAGEGGAGGDAVTAGGRAARPVRRAPNIASLARRQPQPPAPPAQAARPGRGTLVAAVNVPDTPAGTEFAGMGELAAAARRRFGAMPSASWEGRYQAGLAVIRKDVPEDLVATGSNSDLDLLDRAADESRLPGGSLLAAAGGGWCAPSETWYDLCEMESSDGLLSLPEVVANRGGIRWTPGPDFASIFANTGFVQTEAQAIAAEEKPCYELECPEWQECRLDAIGYCVSSGILTQRAYPELIARFLRGAAAAHAHRYNAETIRRMVEGSTTVTLGGRGSARCRRCWAAWRCRRRTTGTVSGCRVRTAVRRRWRSCCRTGCVVCCGRTGCAVTARSPTRRTRRSTSGSVPATCRRSGCTTGRTRSPTTVRAWAGRRR